MDPSRLTLLGVPIDSVGEAGGTEKGPAALRRHFSPGLDDAGDTSVRLRGRHRDPETGWIAFEDIVHMTAEVRERVADLTATGKVPLILGGCCSLLPGALAGARDSLGEIGLAYFDGHLDLFTGQTSPTGEGADMPMAALLGLAPAELLSALGPAPIVDPAGIAMLGARDEEEADLIAPLPAGLGIRLIYDRDSLEGADLGRIGRSIADRLSQRPGGFWLHLDVDVLDQAVFPATDYLMDGGLDFGELRSLVEPIASAPGLVGLNLTCFNPEKDEDGTCGAALVDLIETTAITSNGDSE